MWTTYMNFSSIFTLASYLFHSVSNSKYFWVVWKVHYMHMCIYLYDVKEERKQVYDWILYTNLTFIVYSRHDQQLVAKLKSLPKTTGSGTNKPLPTQQFGVSLQYIKDANNQDPIPPVLKNCITFLDHPDGKIQSTCTDCIHFILM